MAKSEEEILKELETKYHSNLFDKNGELEWNGINYTMQSYLEIGDTYLEKCSGYGSDDKTDILCVNKSLDEIIRKYGEDNWENMAKKNGDIVRFDPYDRENSIDNYVLKKYNLKSKEQIQEILDTSIDELDLYNSEVNLPEILENAGIETVKDIIGLNQKELSDILGENSTNDVAATIVDAVMKTGISWETGEFIHDIWKNQGKNIYIRTLEDSLSDNVIEPDEWDALNEIAEKYGLSKESTQDTIAEYVHSKYEESGKMPVVAHPVTIEQALSFSSCFNLNKYEVEKKAVEDFPNEPVHYFENMSVELGKEILETLSVDGGYTLYGDFNRNKFWLRDEQTGETEETNFNHILSKVEMITESWNRDETTVNENKFIEQLNSLETDDILVPVDVHYKFKIPEEIKVDSAKAERRLRNGIETAIRNVFYEPSEMIKGSVTVQDGKREADYIFRHNFVASKETNYSNFDFGGADDQLQYAVGISLNDEFGLDHKILFSELKSSVPERFSWGFEQIDINKETIEKFSKTPEEAWKNELHIKVFNEYLSEEKKNNPEISYYLASEIKIPHLTSSRPILLTEGEFKNTLTQDFLKIASPVSNDKEWAEKYCNNRNNSYVSLGTKFYVYDNQYLKAFCRYIDNRDKLDVNQNPPSEEWLQKYQHEKKAFDKVLSENPLLKKYVEEQQSLKEIDESRIKENTQQGLDNIKPRIDLLKKKFFESTKNYLQNKKDTDSLLKAAAKALRNLSITDKSSLEAYLCGYGIDSKTKLVNFLQKNINPPRQQKKKSKSKDADFERTR